MTDSPMLSAFEPPSDPADIPDWLLSQEEEIAALTVRRLTEIVDRSVSAFVNSLSAAGDLSTFDDIPDAWSSFVRTELSDRLGGMYLSGGVSAWIQSPGTEFVSEATAEAWTAVVNESALEYATTATNRLTGPVSDSIWNDLRTKVTNAISTGMSTERLTEEVRLMTEFSKYRAETIARTEVNGAYNAGNYESNQTLGDLGPVEKYWVATGDDRTRETHREADGQVQAFADPFNVGGSQMLYPHDPAGPAKEVINCRCVVGYLYPGMERPDGTIVPDSPAQLIREEAVRSPATTPDVTQIPVRPFGRGPAATQTFSDVVEIPTGTRGRIVERSTVLRETVTKLDELHGLPSSSTPTQITLGGKAENKGGYFSPASRGPRPKRTRGMTTAEWNQKVTEYNARPVKAEIRINDLDLDEQAHFLTHELGHATDWDGADGLRSRRAWRSAEILNLESKYRGKWIDHLDEIQDEETRLFAGLGKAVREAESVKRYLQKADGAYRNYFTSIEEVWARSYAQWVAEVADDPRLARAAAKFRETGFLFSEEEFAEIRPLVEGILRARGLMR